MWIVYACMCFACAYCKAARCSNCSWDEIDKRKVFDAIDELMSDAKLVTVYRIAWSRS